MTAGLYSHGLTVEELFAPQVRCSYPSKVCTNLRAVKLCGSLHKLCEFHRKKANLNQKRLQQRRRVIRAQMAERTPIDHNVYGFQTAPALPTTMAPTANVYENDELSDFETSLLDSLVFGDGGVDSHNELPAAQPISGYGYAGDNQAHLKFEPFSYELRLWDDTAFLARERSNDNSKAPSTPFNHTREPTSRDLASRTAQVRGPTITNTIHKFKRSRDAIGVLFWIQLGNEADVNNRQELAQPSSELFSDPPSLRTTLSEKPRLGHNQHTSPLLLVREALSSESE